MACFGGDISLFCHVLLLDETEYPLEIRKKTKGFEVLEKVYDHLNLLERDYFGLRYIDKSGQSRWLDPLKVVIKQLKSGPPYLLYFGVKFYAPDPCKLQEELTRYQFFMQVKRDIFQGRVPCSYNLLVELSAYAIQSELGDYDPRENTDGYVSEFRFIPNQSEDLEEKVSSIHRKLTGLVPSVAEIMYLDKIKWLEMYGVDLHPVKGEDFVDYFVALKPAGVVVYKNKTKVGTYLWPMIIKIDFKGKTFFLTVEAKNDMEYTYVFYLSNKSACKHLWKCCLEHHAFFRLEKLPNARKSSVGGLFRTGSGFRYSGRTHREVLEDSKRIARPSPDVLRKPSKRYERRNNQGNERAQSAVTVTSVSEVQIRKFNQSSTPNASNKPAEVITVPVRTPSKPTTKTNGEPTLGDGNRTVINAVNGPALPWEQNADRQSGLYTPAPQSPHSLKSSGSGRSRKFPRPHRRSAGPSSGSETDTPRKRHRSAHGSHSDDDTGRRRRRRSRHRHRGSGYSGSESEGQSSRGGRRHQRAHSEPENYSDYGDAAPYHWNGSRGLGRPGSVQDRSHQHKSLPPDRDARSDGSSSRRRHSKPMTEEMVPALDVIQSRVAVARVKDGTRHHHHRRHHHHHHSNYHTSNESLHSSVSASPAARPSPQGMQVLLQLGPGSSGQKYPQTSSTLPNSPSKRAAQTGAPVTQLRSSPFKENIPFTEMPYGSLPNRMKQNGGSVNMGYPNGMIIAGTPPNYPPNKYTANGGVPGYSAQRENRDKNYIEMVSGPGQSPVYYQGRNRAMSGKSTML